jgi:hypothetical protein
VSSGRAAETSRRMQARAVRSFSTQRKVRTKKFLSSERMVLWTDGRPDGISRRLDGCCLTDERPDGIPRRSDSCKGSDYTVLKSAQNLLETYL